MVEEGEDLHVLIKRLGVAPVALYGLSSGGRSNRILASRYPDDVAALVIAPLTGGPLAAMRLSNEDFLAAMKTSGEHLQATRDQSALGMNDEDLAALEIPATLILHHGSYRDYLHPITNTRAATTLIPNSSFKVAPYLPDVLDALLPLVREHTPKQKE